MDIFQYAANVCALLNRKLDDVISRGGEGCPERLSVPFTMSQPVAKAVEIILIEASRAANVKIDWKCECKEVEQGADFSIAVTPKTLSRLRQVSLREHFSAMREEVTGYLAPTAEGAVAKILAKREFEIKEIDKEDFITIQSDNFSQLISYMAKEKKIQGHQHIATDMGKSLKVYCLDANDLFTVKQPEKTSGVTRWSGEAPWTPDQEPDWISGEHLLWLMKEYYKYDGAVPEKFADRVKAAEIRNRNTEEIFMS